MKLLSQYILEKFKINSKTISHNILDVEKMKNYEWPDVTGKEIQKCKENTKNFVQNSKEIEKLYPSSKPYERLELLYRDTYRVFIGLHSNKSDEYLDNQYEDEMKRLDKIIKETGWGNYEYNCLPQGWWHMMNYAIEKNLIR